MHKPRVYLLIEPTARVMTNLMLFLIKNETAFRLEWIRWEAGDTLPTLTENEKVLFVTSPNPTNAFLRFIADTQAAAPAAVAMYLDSSAVAAREIAKQFPADCVWVNGNYGGITDWVFAQA